MSLRPALAAALLALTACSTTPPTDPGALPPDRLRVATFNVSLYAETAGGVVERLRGGKNVEARKVAAIIQTVRPDVLLLNEFDYDGDGVLADVFQREYLGVSQHGQDAISYPYQWAGPVNTGVPSGLDLNQDGITGGEGRSRGDDAWGYGLHPGQYGLLVLSRYPIANTQVRTFQRLRWATMPGARRPHRPDGHPFHPDDLWVQLRLSSKTHADVPIDTPLGPLHFLVSHPTPPVFDGPENRNGARNADELQLWRHYLDGGGDWLMDDAGHSGGLPAEARFVIAGDLNNDVNDGDGDHTAIAALINHPRVLPMPAPRSDGATAASAREGGINAAHRGEPAEDTGQFGPRVGNLRLDYVLPSRGWTLAGSGVFWPKEGETGANWIDASDHHLVWVDLLPVTEQAR